MASAVSRPAPRGFAAAVPRAAADGADANGGGADPGEDTTSAAGWQHALEYAEAGSRARDSSQPGREDLATGWTATASIRAVHAVRRPGLRDQSRRRHWLVCQSAGSCGRVRGRREIAYSGPRPPRSD